MPYACIMNISHFFFNLQFLILLFTLVPLCFSNATFLRLPALVPDHVTPMQRQSENTKCKSLTTKVPN